MKILFKDYEVHHKIILFGFSLIIALSCTMFELIIFEILGFLDPISRKFHWKFGLYFILFLLVFAIPYTISYLIVKTSGFSKFNIKFYNMKLIFFTFQLEMIEPF
jgi:hypothetical protein